MLWIEIIFNLVCWFLFLFHLFLHGLWMSFAPWAKNAFEGFEGGLKKKKKLLRIIWRKGFCLYCRKPSEIFVSVICNIYFKQLAISFSLAHRKGILCPWRPLSIRPWQRPSYCRWCQPTGHDSLPTPTCYAPCRPAHAPNHRATPSPQDAFVATLWPAAATGRLPNDW